MPGFVITSNEKSSGPSPVIETARSHRWNVSIAAPIAGIERSISFYAHSVTRPSIEIDKMVMHHRQGEINLPGKHRYGTSTIKFYEKVDPDKKIAPTVKILRQWWSEVVLNLKECAVNLDKFRGAAFIVLEDGEGYELHSYQLINAWPSKVESSELDYSSSEIATTTVTLVYDAVREF